MTTTEPTVTDLVVELLDNIWERDQQLTAEAVVAAAADPTSPLHNRFEWDDTAAAHQFRLEQARRIIRNYDVQIQQRTIRRFAYVRSADSYVPIKVVLDRKDYRDEVLLEFERAALAFEKRWKNNAIVAEHWEQWIRGQLS